MSTRETDLLPCPNPWCVSGTPPIPAYATRSMRWRVICACGVRTFGADTEGEAVAAWNTRALSSPPSQREDLEGGAQSDGFAAESRRKLPISGGADLSELRTLLEKATKGPWELLPASFSPNIYLMPANAGADDQAIASVLMRADALFIAATRNALPSLLNEVEAMREALEPSGDTKAAYMGEFSFSITQVDEYGDEQSVRIPVPWTRIKEIMAAIRDRARSTLNRTAKGMEDGRLPLRGTALAPASQVEPASRLEQSRSSTDAKEVDQ